MVYKMILRFGRKIVVSILLLMVLCVAFGGLIHTLHSFKHETYLVHAATSDFEEDKVEEDKDDKKEKDDKKDKDTKHSYASILFDKTDKNQSMMYFNSQTRADVPTVQSTIDEEAKNGSGEAYAAFLNTLGKWNLYNTYTSQLDAGIGIIGKTIRFIVGVSVLGCLYLMDGIDALLKIIADLVDYLNIFSYLVDSSGNIPQSNPLHVLQPIVDLYKDFTVFAKVILAILLGTVLFRVAILGTKRPKGPYLGRGLSKVALGLITIAVVPLMLSAYMGIFADLIRSDKNAAKSTIADVPSKYIVDTRGYIDNSLTLLKDKKNNDALNGGYVLLHNHQDIPTTEKQVNDNIPTQSMVKYFNTGNIEGKKNPSGKELVWKWMTGDTFTADDVDSMYSLSKDDKSHGWAIWENDEKRAFQFKLAYGPESVKTFDGKDPFSLDLNGVSIQSASLAGNGPMGVVLNGIKMTTVVYGVTFVVVTLVLSILYALIKSAGLFGSNISIASLGSPQGAFGILATIIMLSVSWTSALMIIPLYSSLTGQIDELMTTGINNQLDMGGLGKQTLLTVGVVFTQWICAILALKGRGALMNGISDFFKSIIDRVSSYTGTHSTGRNRGAEALSAMNNADQAGYQNNLDRMTAPINKSKDALSNLPVSAMGYGKDKLNEAAGAIKDKASDSAKSGLNKAKESAANLKKRLTSDEEVNDIESQGSDLNDQFEEGVNAMNQDSVSGMHKNLDDQDKAVDKAIGDQKELDYAQKGLEDAKNHYNDLEENGASKSELAQAQEDIDKAQDRYDQALANSQASARNMAGTGASAASIAEGKKVTAEDFQKANRDVASAKNDLASLKEERNEMERNNAPQEAIDDINNEIGQAEDRLANAEDRQELAKAAHTASIGNAQIEKDSRNDVVSARQAVRDAEKAVVSAKETGNLSPQEQNTVRRTAGAASKGIETLKNIAQKDLTQAEATKGALQYMYNNHNQAFTDTDKENYAAFADSASASVNAAKQQLTDGKKNNASKSQIASLSQQLMDANKMQASAQTVMKAIDTGRVSSSTIAAQQQIVESLVSEQATAEKQMANLNHAAGNGETISRGMYNSVKSNLSAANQKAAIAQKALTSLQAMKAAGTNHLNGNQMDKAMKQADLNIDNAMTKHTTLSEASAAMNHVNSGGSVTRENLLQIVKGQKLAENASLSKLEAKREEFGRVDSKLASLKSQLANGKPVGYEVQRMQNNYDQIEKELTNAENMDKAVRTSGQTFRKVGRTMSSNLKAAKNDLTEKQNIKITREDKHNQLLQSGGYTQEQLSDLKKDIYNQQNELNHYGKNFARERMNQLEKIKKDMDKADKIMRT